MAEFNFSWTEPPQISVVHGEQFEGTLLIRVLWSRIVPVTYTALDLVVASLKWCQCPKIRNLQEFFFSPLLLRRVTHMIFLWLAAVPKTMLAWPFLHSACLWVEHEYCYYWPYCCEMPVSVDIFRSVVEFLCRLFYTFLLVYVITFLWFQ